MSNDDNTMVSIYQVLRKMVDMKFHSAGLGVEEVRHKGNVIALSHDTGSRFAANCLFLCCLPCQETLFLGRQLSIQDVRSHVFRRERQRPYKQATCHTTHDTASFFSVLCSLFSVLIPHVSRSATGPTFSRTSTQEPIA
jgi:hypothetical protein